MKNSQINGPWGLSLLAGSALLLGACATQSPPEAQTARLGCEQLGENAGADYLAPGRLHAVSPVTESEFVARAIQPQRTIGADLYVRAEPGLTSEYLERSLSCRAQQNAVDDVLHPSTGVARVSVSSADAGFQVRVLGSTPEAGREIWQRAEALTRPGVAVEQVALLDAQSIQ